MIKKIYLSIAVLIMMALSFNSCNWIDTEINKDPDAVTEVPLKLLLPSIEVRMAYTLGGQDVAGVTAMWTQQAQGVARQSGVINSYNFTEADVNNLWGSMYDGGMMDAYQLINQATEEAPHYKGIGQVLMALWLGNATDLFGDIPYSTAFNGEENLAPTYDTQEQIYATIQSLLDEAITNLSSTNNLISVEGDYFFDGDPSKWLRVAYTLKARYALHLSERNGTTALDEVINIVESGNAMQGNSDDLAFEFGESTTENNPVYQFSDQRGDMRNGPVFFAALQADNDPREIIYEAIGGQEIYYGGIYYGDRTSPVDLCTYTELMFMAAEAYNRTGDDANATASLIAAVTANINKYMGLDNTYDATAAAWLAAKVAAWNITPPTLEEIMTQKWIALYLSPEAYVDYRRTGFPNLTPVTGTSIPSRFPYPTDERLYNPNTPNATIWQSLWWDN